MSDEILRARADLVGRVRAEFVGPGSEGQDGELVENERISESPLRRYALGILYPQKAVVGEDIVQGDAAQEEEPNDVPELRPDLGDDIPAGEDDSRSIETDQGDQSITGANQFCPSSFAISFFVPESKGEYRILVEAAKYRRLTDDESFVDVREDLEWFSKVPLHECYMLNDSRFYHITRASARELRGLLGKEDYLRFSRVHDKASNFKSRGFRRTPVTIFDDIVNFSVTRDSLPSRQPEETRIIVRQRRVEDGKLGITISVINLNHVESNETKYSHPEMCLFQNRIRVVGIQGSTFLPTRRIQLASSRDAEEDMLFAGSGVYAVGHGCSVVWKGEGKITEISTEYTPMFESAQTNPTPKAFESTSPNILRMTYLAFGGEREPILIELENFGEGYGRWIEGLEKIAADLDAPRKFRASKALLECRTAKQRILDGVNLLRDDDLAWEAFRLANEAMAMQRYHSETYLKKPRKLGEGELVFPPDYSAVSPEMATWRPFQLGFLLINLRGIVDPTSIWRRTADLLWFPTGGGKTEAYLGCIAFTIFFRRLKYGSRGLGTSVIMRYTLRLLTAQQYLRASTLILACELIRRKNPRLEKEEITIGLWVGRENTPNLQAEAAKKVAELLMDKNRFRDENPFQIAQCPWCGTDLINEARPERSGYVARPQFHFQCIEPKCSFSGYLPLQVVDEIIYSRPPSLLFGTVDKFAMVAWKHESMSFFGLECNKDRAVSYIRRPPDLILQDELHLISGPLGSLFGLYEAVLDYLCSSGGHPPKVICSTATIKRASDQIRLLFNRSAFSFPPSGLDMADNYFSELVPLSEAPGRVYLGLMSVGVTQTSALIKALSTLLYGNIQVPEVIKDKYYTLVCYFNTIKEMGHVASLLDADVREKIITLQARYRTIFKRPMWRRELTSRERSSEIPKILDQLTKDYYPSKSAIPIVLSTNMFSVGVDISRLNLMFVSGQPKGASEYIQATSRVGRRDPGLVVVLYDGFRPRDRSHYENFVAFHQSFYRYVEPTGVTPFSEPARRRGLHTLLVIAARHRFGLPKNKDAAQFAQETIDDDFRDFLLNRIWDLDQTEKPNAAKEIDELIQHWVRRRSPELVYAAFSHPNASAAQRQAAASQEVLMRPYGDPTEAKDPAIWYVLQSLRNVDIPTVCVLED